MSGYANIIVYLYVLGNIFIVLNFKQTEEAGRAFKSK